MKSPQSTKRPKGLSALQWKGLYSRRDQRKYIRIVWLIAIATMVITLSAINLGVYQMSNAYVSDLSFVIPLITPIVASSLIFGPLVGGGVGLLAGIAALTHASTAPTTYYEQYYVTIVSSVVLYPLVGFLFGLVASVIDRRVSAPSRRWIAWLALSLVTGAVICVVGILCVFASEELQMAFQLAMNTIGKTLASNLPIPTLVNTLFAFVPCIILDAVAKRFKAQTGAPGLSHTFQEWLIIVVLIVFMAAAAGGFIGVSADRERETDQDLRDELTYISSQIENHGATPASVLDGYTADVDGEYIVFGQNGVITSNSDRYPAGMTLSTFFGSNDEELLASEGEEGLQRLQESAWEQLKSLAESDETMLFEESQKEGGFRVMFIRAINGGDYIIVGQRTQEQVYADRPAMMGWTALVSFLELVAVYYIATLLLKRVVIQRIDETNESLGRITAGDLNERVNITDSREFASLSQGINTTVHALHDSIDEVKARNAQDLMTAKAIQASALPHEFPPFPDIDRFDIYASMNTAKEVGGDFYDFFLIDENHLGFVMADVSGKGIPAALFMMTAKTHIQGYMEDGLPLDEAIAAANHQLCIGNDAGMFVTVYACVLNYETGLLTCVNAGHNPPLILHDGSWEWLRTVSGMPLGLFDGLPYKAFTRQIEPGDLMYLYTDGVTEAMSVSNELFDEGRLEQILIDNATMNPCSLCASVTRALADYTEGAEQSDDITMLAIKYGVPPEKKATMVLTATKDQLKHVCNFVHEELDRHRAPQSVYNPIDIAIEELFVNVCHYAYPDATPDSPGPVRVSFEYEAAPPSLTVIIEDDGIPYNPLAKPDAVTPDDIMEVPIGGLGILMAKKSVDDMEYERIDGSNVLMIRKCW